jgi:hypothetical protein
MTLGLRLVLLGQDSFQQVARRVQYRSERSRGTGDKPPEAPLAAAAEEEAAAVVEVGPPNEDQRLRF